MVLKTYSRTAREDVRFEFFTAAVTMKNAVFWDVTPCGSCKNRRFFGGMYSLHHQRDKNRQSRINVEARCEDNHVTTISDFVMPEYLKILALLHRSKYLGWILSTSSVSKYIIPWSS
jgi:hypothetical protein